MATTEDGGNSPGGPSGHGLARGKQEEMPLARPHQSMGSGQAGSGRSLAGLEERGGRRGARWGSGDEAQYRARNGGFRRGGHPDQDGAVAGVKGAAGVANSTERIHGGRRKTVAMALLAGNPSS